MRAVKTTLSPEVYDLLDLEAGRQGRTIAALLRDATALYLCECKYRRTSAIVFHDERLFGLPRPTPPKDTEAWAS